MDVINRIHNASNRIADLTDAAAHDRLAHLSAQISTADL